MHMRIRHIEDGIVDLIFHEVACSTWSFCQDVGITAQGRMAQPPKRNLITVNCL